MRRGTALAAGLAMLVLTGCSSDDGTSTGDTGGDVVQVPGTVTDAGSLAFLDDALRVVAPCDGELCVWSTSGGALVDRFDGGGIVASAGSGLYTDRVTGGAVEIVLLDEVTGDELASAEAYPATGVQDGAGEGLRDIAVSPDGASVAVVGADGLVRRWASGALTDASAYETDGDAVALAWSADSSRLAVASSDAPVVVLDATTGEQVGELDAPPQGDVAWSGDGNHLATASYALDEDAATTIWDATTFEQVASLDRPGYRLAFRGDDALVLSEKESRDLLLWSWTRDDLRTYTGATDVPRAVLVALGGSRTYAVSPRDGVLEWTSPDQPASTFEKPGE